MRRSFALFIVMALVFPVSLAPFARADNDAPGKGKSPAARQVSAKHLRHDDDRNKSTAILISKTDREVLRDFLGEERKKSCPPGLARKDNGCLPPGIAKMHAPGDRLAPDDFVRDLPKRIADILGPPRKGQKYVVVDEEVLLIAEATQLILDVVRLSDSE